MTEENASHADVIDRASWLRAQVERLVAAGDPAAIDYLERLLELADDDPARYFCHARIGLIHFRLGDYDAARRAFLDALAVDEADPGVWYALGRCADARGRGWYALLYGLRAVHNAGEGHDDGPEFLRTTAETAASLGYADAAISMLLGALDRAPENPAVLESLARLYERNGQWLDAIDSRDALIGVLKRERGEADAAGGRPGIAEMFGGGVGGFDEDVVRQKVRAISDRMRRDFHLVDEVVDDFELPEAGLTRVDLPSGLHTLVGALARRERNLPLLEMAQTLWARAWHDRFDVYLTPDILAAAIHFIVERFHWRVPTPPAELAAMYRAEEERVRAAVRLVVSRFAIAFFPVEDAHGLLGSPERDQLANLQRSMLYGLPAGEVEGLAGMLVGS